MDEMNRRAKGAIEAMLVGLLLVVALGAAVATGFVVSAVFNGLVTP